MGGGAHHNVKSFLEGQDLSKGECPPQCSIWNGGVNSTVCYVYDRTPVLFNILLVIIIIILCCSKLCTEEMTCFEPEACSQLVTGMEFHKFYFDHCKYV